MQTLSKIMYSLVGYLGFVFPSATAGNLPSAVEDTDYYFDGSPDSAKVKLGKKLFFDKILSGNENISCATCHHPLTETGDGLSLPVGEGGIGLGVTRDTGTGSDAIFERVPRNAPPLFDLGARSMTHMFHDGRIVANENAPSGFDSPAGNDLPSGLDNVLAVQAMFPVTSAAEMAGQLGENEIANATHVGNLAGPNGVWAKLADRLRSVPRYVTLFNDAYGINASEIKYVHAANAIAAYESKVFRSDKSPFDRYLRGNANAMSSQAVAGMNLFYGSAGCSSCHSGAFQTDMSFHAIAMPQIGPGKGVGYSGQDDFGRELVTGNSSDRYKFRTPPLRNVALTAPYGHDGAYPNLRQVIKHHLSPVDSFNNYDCDKSPKLQSRADLNDKDCVIMSHQDSKDAILSANELAPMSLTNKQINQLIAFLWALSSPNMLDLRSAVPMKVPSKISVAE